MNELTAWADRTARRERAVVRLEDALLAGRFARYFLHRMRFFIARTAISTVIHAIKIVLLLGAFPRSQFLAIIILQGAAGLTGDFWWGALEVLRTRVRDLQARGARHVVPREIARWLSLSARLSLVGLIVAGVYALDRVASGFQAVDLYIVALVIGVSLDVTARTYHSGAYAIRRVYRPLPSLLALDVVSVGLLLALWPIVGIWAFPIAELVSAVVVVSITVHYTAQTYRTLALPTLLPLLRQRRPIPPLPVLRRGLAPGLGYALVGLEALVVIAGVGGATIGGGATLVALLAALAPVNRASFEWARLLYFDLKRMDVPLLATLRQRFDRAITKLALVIGVVTWLVAAAVALWVVAQATLLLIVALLALFGVRSLLAAAQMQAFTRDRYLRLIVAGVVGVLGVLVVFSATTEAELRLLGVSAALALSMLVLFALPPGTDPGDAVVSLPDWLRRVRLEHGPVNVSRLSFDDRFNARGTSAEARRAEAWRREAIGRRLGAVLGRRRGALAWAGPLQLWCYEPVGARQASEKSLIAFAAGLVHRPAAVAKYSDTRAAAVHLAADAVALTNAGGEPGTIPAADELIEEFERLFPAGIAYDVRRSAPIALARMPSDLRVEVYRAALEFAHDPWRNRGLEALEVTALVEDGSLRAIFIADRRGPGRAHREWRQLVRAWTIRSAAGIPVATDSERGYALGTLAGRGEGSTALTAQP
jgi:hypothetical protein